MSKAKLLMQVTGQGALVVAVAAIIANLAESVLGAAVQGKQTWLTNNTVNMLQISFAALLAVLAARHGIGADLAV